MAEWYLQHGNQLALLDAKNIQKCWFWVASWMMLLATETPIEKYQKHNAQSQRKNSNLLVVGTSENYNFNKATTATIVRQLLPKSYTDMWRPSTPFQHTNHAGHWLGLGGTPRKAKAIPSGACFGALKCRLELSRTIHAPDNFSDCPNLCSSPLVLSSQLQVPETFDCRRQR